MGHIVTEGKKDIPPDELVWLKDHPYPFYFRRTNENNKPVLYGDFSSGQLGKKGFIESEVEWENVIWPIPEQKGVKYEKE